MLAHFCTLRSVRVLSLTLLVVLLCNGIANAAPSTAPKNPPPRLERRKATGAPTQFGPAGDSSLLVWTERATTTMPAEETDLGTANIHGVDLVTDQPVVITDAAGDQTTPAVSGSVVVWQDHGHSCPTCEGDILAKDVATGKTYDIGTGPADQAMPAIAGRTVTWIENTEQGLRLLSSDLGSTRVVELAAVSNGTTISQPTMSDDLIVWAERVQPDRSNPANPQSSIVFSKLRAYDRATDTTRTVAEPTNISLEYAVSGTQIVYTDPRPILIDLAKNNKRTLSEQFVRGPAIVGDTVLWSASEPSADDLDIYSFDLKGGKHTSLINTPGNQVNPIIIGDTLVWQDGEAKDGKEKIKRKSLKEAKDSAKPRPQTERVPDTKAAGPIEEVVTPMGHTGTYTRPTYKGMHLALGGYNNDPDPNKRWGGWYFSDGRPCNSFTCIVDALGATNAPFFGSFLAMETEFPYNTGRPAPWGPTVQDAMRSLQAQYGTRVIVRTFTYPVAQPNPSGTVYPANVVDKVINLAKNHDWIKHVQLENEPNLEWQWACENCRWNSSSQSYTWINEDDERFYYAINEFYSDAWWEINYWKGNHPDATVRSRLSAMEIWTPPMADFYKSLRNGQTMYGPLQGMIDLFKRMTYHTYPAPNFDADGSGGVKNNSEPAFTEWLRTNITNGTVRTMITEFGWNPGQMQRSDCNMTQHATWPSTGTCAAKDARTHTFDNDIKRFLAYHRYKAEVVAVWMPRGWRGERKNADGTITYFDHTDAIDQNGNTRTWFHNYQWSSP